MEEQSNGISRPEDHPVAKHQEESFLIMIERLSSRPDIDVSKIEKLMDMQERILDRNAKQAFNAAMKRAQNGIELVVSKVWNEQAKSHYSDLKSVLIKAKPIYTEEGFSLMFYEGDTAKGNHKRICVDIMHEDGHTEKRWGDFAIQTTGMAGNPMMTEIHGEGSAFSYGRRYLTCAIFNIPTGDDDDGQAAGGESTEFITPAQAKELHNLITACGDKAEWVTEQILKINEIETIDTLPEPSYKNTVSWLNKAVRKAKEKDRNADH